MKILCKNKEWNIVEDYDINKILYLLIDRPTFINFFDDEFVWENENGYHREYDLPAIVWNCGTAQWYKNSRFHKKKQ